MANCAIPLFFFFPSNNKWNKYKYISCIYINTPNSIHLKLSSLLPISTPLLLSLHLSISLSLFEGEARKLNRLEMAIEAQYNLTMKRTREHFSSNTLLDPTMEMPPMPVKQARLNESGFPSTSGRADSLLFSHFNRVNADTDAIIQLHVCVYHLSLHHLKKERKKNRDFFYHLDFVS